MLHKGMKQYDIRKLNAYDCVLPRMISRKDWGVSIPWASLYLLHKENGFLGLLATSQSDADVRAFIAFRAVPSYVAWWCALPGDEDALIPLFQSLPSVIQFPIVLRVRDPQIERLRLLSNGLTNFKVLGYRGTKATITYDGPERPPSVEAGEGGGEPPDQAGPSCAVPGGDRPRRPESTGVPVVSGASWAL